MASGTGGMTNVPGSKPTIVPPGAQVQLAHPWAANQPAWAAGSPYAPPVSPPRQDGAWRPPGGGNDGGDPIRRYVDKSSLPMMSQASLGQGWRMPLIPAGILSPMLLPGMQAQVAAATAPAPTPTTPTGGTTTSTGGTQQPTPTPQQQMADLMALISGGYNAV